VYPPEAPELQNRGLRIFPGGQTTSMAEVLAAAEVDRQPSAEGTSAPDYALLIVDMQNDFVSPERPAVIYAGSPPIPTDKRARMLANASAAATAVRSRGWPVVHIYTARRADNLDDVHGWAGWREDALPPGVTHVAAGTWGAQIVDELTPESADFIVRKKGASGFGLTHLHRLLRNLGVRRCLVAGGSTTGCVRATMFDGLALGYDITILADATYPPDSPHVEFLAQWCTVRPTDDVLSTLPALATDALVP
jgi:nicotinamidase-related amidase